MTIQLKPDLQTLLTTRLRTTPSEIADFCQRRNIVEFALFGSVLRDDFRVDSDVDVLVVFDPQGQPSLQERLTVQTDLEHLFGRKVDLTEKALIKNPFSQMEIGRTHRILYPLEQANLTTGVEVDLPMTDNARTSAALLDMVEALEAVQEFVAGRTYDDYAADRMLRRAIERELEILGEAANRVPKGFQADHSDIDWGQIIGLRNVIIHRYDQIEDERMWEIIMVQVPQCLAQVKPLVPPLPEE
ncbi:MAG: HepT-like ribonuclease domain-containing protein [Cyanobacteria bacterium J06628_6]